MGKTKADLEREIVNLKSRLERSDNVPPKEREAAATRAQDAREAVEGLSVESVVQDITAVSLTTGKALSDLTQTLVAKTKKLEEIDLAIKVKEQDLQVLYDKDLIGSSIAALLEDHAKQKESLQAEIAELHEQWANEQVEYTKHLNARNNETAIARMREDEQYLYERENRRRSEDAQWRNKVDDRQRAEALRMADFERSITDRETALKAREAEYIAATTRIAGIQTEIESAVKKEVAIATNAISRENKHAAELAQRDHAAQLAAAQAQVTSLQSENARLLTQVTDLGVKLSEAYTKTVNLSEKALEAASGRQALTELRDLQSTQNNGQRGSKS